MPAPAKKPLGCLGFIAIAAGVIVAIVSAEQLRRDAPQSLRLRHGRVDGEPPITGVNCPDPVVDLVACGCLN
jgi:hypothetical protein